MSMSMSQQTCHYNSGQILTAIMCQDAFLPVSVYKVGLYLYTPSRMD